MLADLAIGQSRNKLEALQAALEGRVRDHHRCLPGHLLDQWEFLEAKITQLEADLREQMGPFQEVNQRLDTIPGVNETLGWTLVSELGVDMTRFQGRADRAAAWSGLCPGNRESAGQRLSGRMRPGNRYLRRALRQAAWAASKANGTYLQAQFRRLAAGLGKKRAILAVAHSILVIAFQVIARNEDYHDLGGDYFDRRDRHRSARRLVRRLEPLGHKVILQPLAQQIPA